MSDSPYAIFKYLISTPKKEKKIFPNKAYQREFRRLFGNSKFDYVMDFSGYSMFWSNLLLATEPKKKLRKLKVSEKFVTVITYLI